MEKALFSVGQQKKRAAPAGAPLPDPAPGRSDPVFF